MLIPFLSAQDPFQSAVAAFQQGRFHAVLSLLSKASEQYAHNPDFHSLRSMALTEMGRYDAALRANQEAQQLDPTNPNYLYNAGLIHLKEEDFRGAEKVFQQAVRRFPTSPAPYEGLGDTLFEQDRLKEAEKWLRKAIELDPASGTAYVLLAKLFYAIGDEENLGWASSNAIQLMPNQYLACYYHGRWLLEYRQDVRLASQYIQKSVALSPGFAEGLKVWAGILSRQGRWREAVRAYERAVSVDPEDSRTYYLLATAYRRLGEEEKANRAIREYQRQTQAGNRSQ